MAAHNELGAKGEALALTYLQSKGFRILEQNWRYKKAEVDLIIMDGEVLVFVEVKTRSTDIFGAPEFAVTAQKPALLSLAAAAYMEQINHDWEIRFDVVSIVLKPGYPQKIEHLKDAFFWGL